MEWAYYKGLESALARGQYYKSRAVRALEGKALENFAKQLAGNQEFYNLIPKPYRNRMRSRTIKADEVKFMLAGIIQRERSATDRLRKGRN
jgi:hypothetical protein